MTILEDIANKESETLELKSELSDDSLTFVKTIIGFSNGVGGLLVIGIKEGTHEPIGIPDRDQQYIEERIISAVASMCEPQIIPTFSWTGYKGSNVLIVSIRSGAEKPYHIKGKAKGEGTYIRIGPTTHLAKQAQIHELEQYGKTPFDRQRNYEVLITDGATQNLCDGLSAYGKRKFTKSDLITLQVIKKDAGTEYPTNAYTLLTGDVSMGLYHIIECAVFRGKEKGVFIDRATFRDPIYEQIENAHKFVIKNIKVGQWLPDGKIAMQNIFEVPSEAIRESIANAVTHRNYNIDNANIYVAVYDDRIEITSPGTLPPDTTMANALSGISTSRNQTLASVFKSAGVTEGWGTGIGKIIRECRAYGLKDPTFEQRHSQFVVTLYRSDKFDPEVWYRRRTESDAMESLQNRNNTPDAIPTMLTNEEMEVYKAISSGNGNRNKDISRFTGFSISTVKRTVSKLKDKGIVDREGANRNGRFIINYQKDI